MSYKTDLLLQTDTFFHIYNRGTNRGRIFFSRDNYLYFLQKVRKYREQFGVSIISYCLMPNHFHFLVLQRIQHAISDFMKLTSNSYAKALNKWLGRTGHLFEGKYKIRKVDSDVYLIHLSRYLHINPVRAKLVERPEEWEFSSYRDYLGLRKGTLPEPKYILNIFKSTAEYREFVNDFKPQDLELIQGFMYE
ncbi:MAG: transposase [bacterium]